jgi:hypothetical protein
MSDPKIHSLDSLEKEIYRLKLKQKDQEQAIRKNISSLQRQGLLRILGSAVFGRTAFTRHEKLNRILNRFTDDLTGRFAERADEFLERLFRKKKR